MLNHKTLRLMLLMAGVLLLVVRPVIGQEAEKHFLWRVEGENNDVYLLGSIHVLKAEHYPLSPVIENTFNEVEQVLFEVDFDSLNAPHVQSLIMSKSLYQNGETLPENLSKQTYQEVKQKIETYGFPIEIFHPFKPWSVAMTILASEIQKWGLRPDYGVDHYFYDKAKETNKTIGALESPAYQINLLADLPDKQQELFLKYTLADLETMHEELDKMITAWKNGDTDQLADVILQSVQEYPDTEMIYNLIIYQRNENWIPKIQELLKADHDVLVIVGAGHLVGETSVIDLLRKDGYVVEQL